MRFGVSVFLFFLYLCPAWSSDAGFVLEPYLGYGVGNIKLGDGAWVDEVSQGFLLGLQADYFFSSHLGVGVDYSRGGPYSMKLKTGEKLYFNLASLGAGLKFRFNLIHLWAGYYIDDKMEEISHDFSYQTHKSLRVGLGVELYSDMLINIYYETHELVPRELPSSIKYEICASEDGNRDAVISFTNIVLSVPF